jgi:hypothetical protein
MDNSPAPTSGDRFVCRSLSAPADRYFNSNEETIHRAGYGAGIRLINSWNVEWVIHKYLYVANNNAYQRDWTIIFSR